MSKLKNVAVNTAIVYSGKLVGILISTVTLGIVARYLGVEQYGDYAAVLAYSAVVVAVADLGIGWLTTREIALGHEGQLRFLRSLKIMASVVAIAASVLILPILHYRPSVTLGIFLIILYTYVTSLNSLQVGILQGHSSLGKTVYADTAGRLVNLVLAYIIAQQDGGLVALFLALNVVGVTVYIINAVMIRTVTSPIKGFTLQGIGAFRYDLITMPLVSAISYLVYRVDMLILARLASPVDVGIYAAAYRIIDVAVAVPAILVGTLLPLFTQVIHGEDLEERGRIFRFGYSSTFFVGGLAATVCVVAAQPVIHIVMGSAYLSHATQHFYGVPITAVQVLQILGVFLYFSFVGSLLSGLILAAKRQHAMIIIGAVGLVITVGGNVLLISHYSYVASAFLTVFTEMCLVIGMILSLIKTGWLRDFWWPGIRSLIATSTAILSYTYVMRETSLASSIVVAVAVYGGVALLLGKQEREVVRRLGGILRQKIGMAA
jgi:O-antigen/teichoic acid export membrane protein